MTTMIGILVSDRQFADFTRAAEQLSMSVDEAVSLFLGLGFGHALQEGLIGPRAQPMTREELMVKMFDWLGEEGGEHGGV